MEPKLIVSDLENFLYMKNECAVCLCLQLKEKREEKKNQNQEQLKYKIGWIMENI